MIKTQNQSMHKNHNFTNKNTHKLNVQAERDIPCERETESVSNSARERDRERDSDGEWGRSRDWEGEWEYLCGNSFRLRGRWRVWEREIARLRGLVCGLGMFCSVVGNRWFKCGVIGRHGWAVLELHELGYQVYFLNSDANVRCHVGTEKWGTRAHQDRVPQKVVLSYIFPKQCFGPKYFKN